MYKCHDCDCVFETPNIEVEDMTPGFSSEEGFMYKYNVCPSCNSTNFSEAEQCDCCSEWVSSLTETEGMKNGGIGRVCDQCLEDLEIEEVF